MEGFSTLEEKRDYKLFIWIALIALVILGVIYVIYKIGTIQVTESETPVNCISVNGKDCNALPYSFRLAIAQSGVGNPDCNCKFGVSK